MEIYKDVIGYEGIYKVSNLGNVKSFKYNKERKLSACKNSAGYLSVNLCIDKIQKSRIVHQLVAESFLNHKRCGLELVINHKDFDRTNNKLDNIEIVTQRENNNRKHLKSSSKYVGVHWNKQHNKWCSQIVNNRKTKHLGYFTTELEASKAYINELEIINENSLKEFYRQYNPTL
jgi:hypothetical protein